MAKKNLQGQVAIVTGASSGVGWETCRKLAEAGMSLCITARRAEPLEALRAELVSTGAECIAVPGDVTVQEDVYRVVDACIRHYRRVDLLVNDAAVQVYGTFEEYEWREIERVVDVNFFGYLRYARAVLPHFRRQGSGHILNVLSVMSFGALPYFSAYAATKHALLGWAACLRYELHGTGIDVSNVLLPAAATPLYDHALSKLGRAPKPLPPIYETEYAARAVLRCARAPDPKYIPAFLQGTVILGTQRWLPRIADLMINRWGKALQLRKERVDPKRGNLFEPLPEGVGPKGKLRPTPRWKRYVALSALFAGTAGAASGLGYGALRGARALGR